MSLPIIIPNQTFSLSAGNYAVDQIDRTGTTPLTWTIVGLPDGLTFDYVNGGFYGTPIQAGVFYSFVVLQNSEGTDSSVVEFKIEDVYSSSVVSFSISPNKGYANSTPFQFVPIIAGSQKPILLTWEFGDGSISNEQNPIHIYKVPGKYIAKLHVHFKGKVISYNTEIFVNLLINESVYFDFVPPPTFSGHYNRYPFKVNFTSSKKGPHYIDLGAQFSRSYQLQEVENKWSFLRPHWRFVDLLGNEISTIIPNETEIYTTDLGAINTQGTGLFSGVTGTAEFYFIDDIYNYDLSVKDDAYSTVIATLRTNEIKSIHDGFHVNNDLPGFSNSLATASCPYMVLHRPVDNVNITDNGKTYSGLKFENAQQPVIINTNYLKPFPEPFYWKDDSNEVDVYYPGKNEFSHNFPLENQHNVTVNAGATGMRVDFVPLPTFEWKDKDNLKTPGYYKGNFIIQDILTANPILTASADITYPPLSTQHHSPILWISNPEAGLMTTAQYIFRDSLSAAFDTPNMKIAVVNNFNMPIIRKVDFTTDAMAITGFHGINSIAALPLPAYHAWALDSELNYLYRLTTKGTILCAIDINQIIRDNSLGFLTNEYASPASIVLDGKQNIWMTLYDTVSTLKFDRFGNFLFATTPLSSTGYIFPPAPNIEGPWYAQNSYYDYDESEQYDWNTVNNKDVNFVEPTYIDSDTKNNVWVSYSHYASGYLVKYDSNGGLIYSHTYPVCSCPQSIAIDADDNVWIALSNNIWSSRECTLEKRSSTGTLLSSFYPIMGLNHLTLDWDQNIWFTFSYSHIGNINTKSGSIFVTDLSGTGVTKNASDWFDPSDNTDETALEGIGCDLKGRVYVINSIENQVYVLDTRTKKFLNKFYVNPQGFTFYMDDQSSSTRMLADIWGKSLQANGDWTGLRWVRKHGHELPYYTTDTFTDYITGSTDKINYITNDIKSIAKLNENFDMADYMKSLAFMPSLIESNVLFDDFLGSIMGKYPFRNDDLGVNVYEKISNFTINNADVDYCNIDQLNSMAMTLNVDPNDLNFNLPLSLKSILNICSINQSRLFGSISLQEDAFSKINNQDVLNRGDLISSLCYTVTAGTPVVLKDKSINKYQKIETSEINSCSAYSISVLAEYIGLGNSDWDSYYEFYTFNPSYDLTNIEGIIDWNNDKTTINRNLSSSKYWYGQDGYLSYVLIYDLYKGLGLI